MGKTKAKVKAHVRDIAADLLALLCKTRQKCIDHLFVFKDQEIMMFENSFPYEETEDQMRAINDISGDLRSTKPMDRLILRRRGF